RGDFESQPPVAHRYRSGPIRRRIEDRGYGAFAEACAAAALNACCALDLELLGLSHGGESRAAVELARHFGGLRGQSFGDLLFAPFFIDLVLDFVETALARPFYLCDLEPQEAAVASRDRLI